MQNAVRVINRGVQQLYGFQRNYCFTREKTLNAWNCHKKRKIVNRFKNLAESLRINENWKKKIRAIINFVYIELVALIVKLRRDSRGLQCSASESLNVFVIWTLQRVLNRNFAGKTKKKQRRSLRGRAPFRSCFFHPSKLTR